MAKIMNFQMKNIKRLTGREGYGYTASLYLDGKRIGTYAESSERICYKFVSGTPGTIQKRM